MSRTIDSIPSTHARTTYCGNVHPAMDLASWYLAAERFSVPIARTRPRPFGLGVWWSHSVVAELRASAERRSVLREWLARHGLEIATLNVFPYGDFHGESVKTAVYEPDWSSEARLHFTLGAAEVAASIVRDPAAGPIGRVLPLSTLPIGFGITNDAALRRAARNLVRCASGFAAIEAETGVCCVLAIEPEPFCLLETVAATREFLLERVFGASDSPVPEATLRRHLGICVDLCHLAVVGEAPLGALDECERVGISVPKIQVSSCLELRDPASALDELLAFDEPRYLHQTVSFDGRLRALDLAEVRVRRAEFAATSGLRTHFHLPLYWDDADAALGSTRSSVVEFLGAFSRRPTAAATLLEVETYTWSVLGDSWHADRDLASAIAAELEFVDTACVG